MAKKLEELSDDGLSIGELMYKRLKDLLDPCPLLSSEELLVEYPELPNVSVRLYETAQIHYKEIGYFRIYEILDIESVEGEGYGTNELNLFLELLQSGDLNAISIYNYIRDAYLNIPAKGDPKQKYPELELVDKDKASEGRGSSEKYVRLMEQRSGISSIRLVRKEIKPLEE
ncbi:MAG: hypothetical protein PHF67_03480 [Candidatus Nanoarchaeia archaeon]|nr:hypothetical protein [Candidatus Nanoarchaeia archaeon]